MKGFLSSILMLFILLAQNSIYAQDSAIEASHQKQFDLALSYLISFKNDSALVILNKLEDELTFKDKINTPFGIRVQYRQAEALEKDHKDEVAINKLFKVSELSRKTEQWDVLTNAYLSLARLQEKIGRSENCLLNLRNAQGIINEHKIDSLYPRFAIRSSSYHRIFSDKDSALYYAKEVLRTAPLFKLPEEKAVGHLLTGLLLRDTKSDVAAQHFVDAGKIWKKIEDYSGYGYAQNNLSRLYFEKKDLKESLRFNDSTLVAAALSIKMGHEDYNMLATAYKHRAKIFNALEQSDSAWIYINKGFDLELEEIKKSNIEKIIEIDSNHKDEQNIQTIAEQKKLIKYERERRFTLLGIILMVLLFASLITFYYFKLRSANEKARLQTLTIFQKNKDLSDSLARQVMLQSEVHHRVKNNLQVIISLLDLQKDDIDDLKTQASIDAMSGRIYSMAAIHEILYQQEEMASVNLRDYVENLCLHFSNFSIEQDKPIFNIEFDNLFFNLETCMPLGMIITELLTNSLKYARMENQKLKINIDIEKLKDGYYLNFKDNGPGFSEDQLTEREGGLGTYLLNSMSRQLNGYITSKNNEGAFFQIFFKEKNNSIA